MSFLCASAHIWAIFGRPTAHLFLLFPHYKEDITLIGIDNGKTEFNRLIAPHDFPMAGSLYRHEPYGLRTDVPHGPRVCERLAPVYNAGNQQSTGGRTRQCGDCTDGRTQHCRAYSRTAWRSRAHSGPAGRADRPSYGGRDLQPGIGVGGRYARKRSTNGSPHAQSTPQTTRPSAHRNCLRSEFGSAWARCVRRGCQPSAALDASAQRDALSPVGRHQEGQRRRRCSTECFYSLRMEKSMGRPIDQRGKRALRRLSRYDRIRH